jgi:hypothetical protein
MKDQIVSYETAVLAKSKGFDVNTTIEVGDVFKYTLVYDGSKTLLKENEEPVYIPDYNYQFQHEKEYKLFENECFAPTQSLLQKWLRETKDMWVTIIFNGITYSISIYGRYTPDEEEIEISDTGSLNFEDKYFLRYEQALEEGLQSALKLITNK